MRVASAEIEPWRILRDTQLPLEGLLVLFGANSSGKTTILEALASMFRGATPRLDPLDGSSDAADAKGNIFFELDFADLPDHPDAELYRRLLCRSDTDYELDPWPDTLRDLLDGADVETARSVLAGAYAERSAIGTREDRALVAAHLFESRLFMYAFETLQVWLVARPPEDQATVDAAIRLAATLDDDCHDVLVMIASGLAKGEVVPVDTVTRLVRPEHFFEELVSCLTLSLDIDSLCTDVHSALEVVHDRFWRVPAISEVGREFLRREYPLWPEIRRYRSEGYAQVEEFDIEPPDLDEVPEGYIESDDGSIVPDEFLVTPGRAYEEGYLHRSDRWLEPVDQDGQAAARPSPDAGGWVSGAWRLRPSLVWVARLLGEAATQLAPSFVQAQGRIDVEILPFALWGNEPSRLRVSLVEPGGRRFDIRVLGSGVARWVAAALRLAASDFVLGSQQFFDPSTGDPIVDPARIRVLGAAARRSPRRPQGVRIAPGRRWTLLLVDEPESHLHPAAVESVGRWLADISSRGAAVVATHHPLLLNGLSTLTRIALVRKDDEGRSSARLVDTHLTQALEDARDEIGLKPADLLLLTRLVLFVEGPHDVAVLRGMFGERLSRAGVHVVPVHGTDNLPGLVESEIVEALGLPMALLTDRTNRGRVRRGEPETAEERAVGRFLAELNYKSVQVEILGHSKADIVEHLDKDVCRRAAPRFPGWEEAVSEWKRARRPTDFKTWVTEHYGLPLDRYAVKDLASECRQAGLIPPALERTMQHIEALAARPVS